MTNNFFDSTHICNKQQRKKNKQNRGIDDCNTFFFVLKTPLTAKPFYWRIDTQNFVNWRSSSPNQFVTEIVSPLPYSSDLLRHILLFVYLFIYLLIYLFIHFFQRTHFFHWLP